MEKEREDLPKVTTEDEELPVFDRGQEVTCPPKVPSV